MKRRAFTLIELLVVIGIVLLVSVIALPVVLPAMQHRQVSEAARIVQAELAGARDAALRTGAPSGIRLLPDPAFPVSYLPNGQIDPSKPLAANRIIPISVPPTYSEGGLNKVDTSTLPAGFMPYPALMVAETAVYQDSAGAIVLNSPASWFWNIRVGDKLQINNAGHWYTVVGPMFITPAQGNPEMFVNVGPPGTKSPFTQLQMGQQIAAEFLWLVNGVDDGEPPSALDPGGVVKDGWIDSGFDGVDNNGNGIVDELAEWEIERWL